MNCKSFFITPALFILILSACTKDAIYVQKEPVFLSELELNYESLDLLNQAKPINLINDDVVFLKDTPYLLRKNDTEMNLMDNDLTDLVDLSTVEVVSRTLNYLFNSIIENVEILSVSTIKSDGEIIGLILHYLDQNDRLRLRSFERNGSKFLTKSFPAELVTNFSLNNLLYVSRILFPNGSSIKTYGVNEIADVQPSNAIDDISLLRFASKYNMLKDENLYGSLVTLSAEFNKKIQDLIQDEVRPVAPIDEPCAVAVHHCQNDDSGSNCQPFGGGCYPQPICSYTAATYSLQTNNLNTQYDNFISQLPSNNLYVFRNWLNTQPRGAFYEDAFYSMANHFQASLDTNLLLNIVSSANKMRNFVDAISNNSSSYILSASDYSDFVQIATESSLNSSSPIYKDLINTLINDAQDYRSKNVTQIKNLTSQPVLFQ